MTRHLTTRALRAIPLGLVVGILAGSALVTHADTSVTAAPTYHTPRAPSPADGHHCWVGDAPKSEVGKVPGGVVLSRGDGPKVYLHSPAAVGAALDHVFKDAHPGMTVWAFCR